MKSTFTINVLFVLFFHLFHWWGVFGVDEETLMSVMEGDSITFNSDLTDVNSNYLTLWRYGHDGFTIAQINRDKIIYSDILNLNGRMSVDDKTGSLTITNTRTKHSGLYKMEISNSTGMPIKIFHLTVYKSQPVDKAEKCELKTVTVTEGDSADLIMEDEIQRNDLIVWRFGDDGNLIVKGDREDNTVTFHLEEIYGDRLKLNYQTGSLTITDSRSTDTGLYKVKISTNKRAEYMRFILTVSGPGVSSGGVAGIVIVVLLVISAAVCVFVFFIRRRTSEIKKHNDIVIDKTQSIKPGDSVILDTGIKEIKKEDKITWKFEGTTIAQLKGDQTFVCVDEIFKDRLNLNPRNGALTIKDTNSYHAGLYKVKMRTENLTGIKIIKVSASDKLQVKEGDSFTLSSGHTEIGDNVFTWKFGNEVITEFSGSQPSVSVKESFKDRVFVDSQTGSLNIKNSRTKDAGLYQLQISERDGTNKPEKKFSVTVRENIKKVSKMIEVIEVIEADSFTLYTGFDFKQRPEMIRWEFKHKCIAELIGKKHDTATVDKDERFSDRLELDFKTGSLTITNAKMSDAGDYLLKTDPERQFIVTVKDRTSSKMISEQKEDTNKEASVMEVMEGEYLTLSTEVAFTQKPDEIKWIFEDNCIVEFTGKEPADGTQPAHIKPNIISKDRYELCYETGSLTIKHIRLTDSGDYRLKTRTGDSEREFIKRAHVIPRNKRDTSSNEEYEESSRLLV